MDVMRTSGREGVFAVGCEGVELCMDLLVEPPPTRFRAKLSMAYVPSMDVTERVDIPSKTMTLT